MLNITDLADTINLDCENGDYFWAYGLIKESKKMWQGDNKNLSCDAALQMLEQVNEVR